MPQKWVQKSGELDRAMAAGLDAADRVVLEPLHDWIIGNAINDFLNACEWQIATA